MISASAPGKIILFGEHAVVFGKPAVALAIDLRLHCSLRPANKWTMNDQIFSEEQQPYVTEAIRSSWDEGALSMYIGSTIPSGSGLGSSAAVTVGMLGALSALKGRALDPKEIAEKAFIVESKVQGRASPIDTSVSSHGHGIIISPEQGGNLLWEIKKDSRHWYVHHCDAPDLSMVIGYTGTKGPTGQLVAKVKRYVDRSTFAKEIIDDIGDLTNEGINALRRRDIVRIGEIMTIDHKLLAILGVSSPGLQTLVDAVAPYSYGSKLTGAGGGGSMIALTDKVNKVCEIIRLRGGTPFIVHTGVDGITVRNDDHTDKIIEKV